MIGARLAGGMAVCLVVCVACDKVEPRGRPSREDSTLAAAAATASGAPVLVPDPAASARPSFPTDVAGFAFGQTIAELRMACANGHDGVSAARLTLNGSYAECPVQPVPLDFTKPQTGFHITGGKAVFIVLTPISYAEGRRRITDKYGQPTWQDVERKGAPGAPDLRWKLPGGDIYLLSKGGRIRILFQSGLAHDLQNEGF